MGTAHHADASQTGTRSPRWHLLVSLAVVLAGLLMSLTFNVHVSEDGRRHIEERFRHHAYERVALINERLDARQRELDSVRRLFENSSEVTADEFQRFSRPLLGEHLAIYQAALLDLEPGHSSQQLAEFLIRASRITGSLVNLQRPDALGQYQPLEPGDRHFPLLLQTSLCQPLPAGLDLGFPGPLRQTLDNALRSSRVSGGSLLSLSCQKGRMRDGLVLAARMQALGDDGRSQVTGVLFSIIDLQQLVNGDSLLVDDGNDLSISLLPQSGNGSSLSFGDEPLIDNRLLVAQPLGSSESWFQLVIRPTATFIERNPLPTGWFTLLPGSLLSLLLGALIYTLLHQRHHAMRQVERRTCELEESRQQLHQSEERWNLALDSAGDGVWDWDMKEDSLYLSPTWKRMLGYGEEQISQNPDEWRNRVHPEDILRCRHALREHLRGLRPHYTCEHRLRCADGSWKWVISRGRVVQRDLDGTPLRLIGTLSDISRRKALELELTATSSRLRALLEAASQVAIIAIDGNGHIETFNRGAERLLGYGSDELQGQPAQQLLPEDIDDLPLHLDRQLHGNQHCELETRLRNSLHQHIPVTLMLSRISDGGYLLVALDISARLQAQAALEERSNLLSKLGAQVPGVLFQMRQFRDGHLSMPWASAGLQAQYGLSPQQVESDASPLIGRILAEDRMQVLESIRYSAARLSRWQQDFRVQLAGRPLRWIHGEAVSEEQPDGSVLWHGYLTDISELKKVEQELRTLTITDSLTGIYNRRHFREQLELELARHARGHGALSVIMLDIDHFKLINDHFGHDVGDLVLKELCQRISGLLRRVDLFCRLGGEEFAILCPQTDLAHAHMLAERLRQGLAGMPFERAGAVSASFGIATALPGDTGDHLLQRSDRALYAAKASGRNRVCDAPPSRQGADTLSG